MRKCRQETFSNDALDEKVQNLKSVSFDKLKHHNTYRRYVARFTQLHLKLLVRSFHKTHRPLETACRNT